VTLGGDPVEGGVPVVVGRVDHLFRLTSGQKCLTSGQKHLISGQKIQAVERNVRLGVPVIVVGRASSAPSAI
jgi:hypothetical protein